MKYPAWVNGGAALEAQKLHNLTAGVDEIISRFTIKSGPRYLV